MRNHKTVVLQQPPVDDQAFRKLCSTVFLPPLWESTLFLLKPKSIEHFIFIGHFALSFDSFVCENRDSPAKNLHIISESLNKITFCEDELDTVLHWPKLPQSVKHVNVINCTFTLSRCHFAMSSEDEFIAAVLPTLPLFSPAKVSSRVNRYGPCGLNWHAKVFVPYLQFNRFVDDKEDECRWDVLKKKLDENNIMWPYPEKQLQ